MRVDDDMVSPPNPIPIPRQVTGHCGENLGAASPALGSCVESSRVTVPIGNGIGTAAALAERSREILRLKHCEFRCV